MVIAPITFLALRKRHHPPISLSSQDLALFLPYCQRQLISSRLKWYLLTQLYVTDHKVSDIVVFRRILRKAGADSEAEQLYSYRRPVDPPKSADRVRNNRTSLKIHQLTSGRPENHEHNEHAKLRVYSFLTIRSHHSQILRTIVMGKTGSQGRIMPERVHVNVADKIEQAGRKSFGWILAASRKRQSEWAKRSCRHPNQGDLEGWNIARLLKPRKKKSRCQGWIRTTDILVANRMKYLGAMTCNLKLTENVEDSSRKVQGFSCLTEDCRLGYRNTCHQHTGWFYSSPTSFQWIKKISIGCQHTVFSALINLRNILFKFLSKYFNRKSIFARDVKIRSRPSLLFIRLHNRERQVPGCHRVVDGRIQTNNMGKHYPLTAVQSRLVGLYSLSSNYLSN
ncbi:hypothetical protein CSKR_100590, partial [Clonorchis sinensis]